MKVKITKIAEEIPNPNGINIGYNKKGELLYQPEIEKPVYIIDGIDSLRTSPVVEILEVNDFGHVLKFKTTNSIYTIEYL